MRLAGDAKLEMSGQASSAEQITHGFLTYAYAFRKAYQPPSLSEQGKSCAGYVCDSQPPDFSNQCLVRSAASPVHIADFQATVSGRFVDQRFFNQRSMVLEILQNAEPRDSKGTWFDLQFYADGEWRSVVEQIGDFQDHQIARMRIVDNGKGYLPTDMIMIGGAKRDDATSAGQFGTGMKISDRSAVGLGVSITRYSRNWRAGAELIDTIISAGAEQILRYKTEFFENCWPGSIVEYGNLTPEMIEVLRNIGDYYLPLDQTLPDRLLDENPAGLVLQPKANNPQIMVKGRIYTLDVEPKSPFLFSYDLRDCVIEDQNRRFVSTKRAEQNIRSILENCQNEAVFSALLQNLGKNCFELQMVGLENCPAVFAELLKRHFGIADFNRAFIEDDTSPENVKILKRRGYKAVNTQKSKFIQQTLLNLATHRGDGFIGIIKNRLYIPDSKDPVTATNHIGFLTTRALNGIKALANSFRVPEDNVEIVGVVEEDDGAKRTVPLADLTTVDVNKLKRLQVSCKNFPVEKARGRGAMLVYDLKSVLEPFLQAARFLSVDFYIYCGGLEFANSPNAKEIFSYCWPDSDGFGLELNIELNSPNLAKQARNLRDYSFEFNPEYSPFEVTPYGDIVSLRGGKVYTGGVLDEKGEGDCILSYNLRAGTYAQIPNIIAASQKKEVPKAILTGAKKNPQKNYLEYSARYIANELNWKEAFEEIFGPNVVVDDLKEDGLHDYADNLAKQSGIEIPNLTSDLVTLLVSCGVKTLSKAVRAERVREYQPLPLQGNLLQVSKLIDCAVDACLPAGTRKVQQNIRVVEADSIANEYGQKLSTTKGGYMDPLLRDTYVFVVDSI